MVKVVTRDGRGTKKKKLSKGRVLKPFFDELKTS